MSELCKICININILKSFIISEAILKVPATHIYQLLWLNLLAGMYVPDKYLYMTQETRLTY
jgi:hypothetical protein